MRDAVTLLQELVRIPSVNPDGDPSAEGSGEAACAQFVARFLESCGATVALEEVLPGRPNVFGRLPSSPAAEGTSKPRLLFAPHTDTVGVRNMTIDPFSGELRDRRIYGRGASDTKGSMAAMLWAIYELRDRIPSLDVEVAFAGLMGEETGQPGSAHFSREHAGEFDFAIVGEPTGLDVVTTHKGCLWARVETTGKAAHGSTPEQGENAIIKMSSLIRHMDLQLREKLAGFTDPILGASTVNIGTCHGGTRANIVADHCETVVDLRLTPSLPPAKALALLESLLRSQDPDVVVTPVLECTPLATDPAHPMIRKLEAAGASRIGAPWFCDAAVLAEGGIPSVAVGPGSIAQAHTEDEYLSITDFENGVAFFRDFLESFGRA